MDGQIRPEYGTNKVIYKGKGCKLRLERVKGRILSLLLLLLILMSVTLPIITSWPGLGPKSVAAQTNDSIEINEVMFDPLGVMLEMSGLSCSIQKRSL